MKRTLERLHRERAEKEEKFSKELEAASVQIGRIFPEEQLPHLDRLLKKIEERASQGKKGQGLLGGRKAGTEAGETPGPADEDLLPALREFQSFMTSGLRAARETLSAAVGLFRFNASLAEARLKEWDALVNNHVGMIFKSMEWRVDKLAAEAGDVKLLMKSFLPLESRLRSLLAALEKQKAPSPEDIKALLGPLEDWRYVGFENRFRGPEHEVQKQLEAYLPYFREGARVLDLGCGRGEFMELLRSSGRRPLGVDLNAEMVGLCRDKGLDCRQRDLLEALAGWEDGALDGVFSSQVIEHLPPAAIKKLAELAYAKLAPSGMIILETINPLSVYTLVHVYYLDMSHRTPVHPRAMTFLLESSGFDEVEVRYYPPLEGERLRNLPGADENSAILNRNIDSLNELLFGPPNYAVIGKKI